MHKDTGMMLIVDDEEPIRTSISRKLRAQGYHCAVAADGETALRKASAQDFDLVVLDVKMPGISGMEVLSRLASDHPNTFVVMLSAVSDTHTAVEAMKLGACDYLTKPFDLKEVVLRVERALERRRLLLDNRQYQLLLEEKVEKQTGVIREYCEQTIQALAREDIAVRRLTQLTGSEHSVDLEAMNLRVARTLAMIAEMHEPYNRGHSERVSIFANDIALQLGSSDEFIKNVQLAAIVHDIGKVVIPDHVLFKSGPLTPAEYSQIKQHPKAAVDILRHLHYFGATLAMIESHHEWYNGKGYPRKLRGEDIPLGARIIAVADAYDAMTSPRPYRTSLSNEDAIKTLRKGARNQWDPAVVDAFIQTIKRESRMLESDVVQNHARPRSQTAILVHSKDQLTIEQNDSIHV